jgi:NADH:ubiquinone oxidoreductase subunit E
MATPFEIEQQVQLERDQIKQGLKRLHKNTKDLEVNHLPLPVSMVLHQLTSSYLLSSSASRRHQMLDSVVKDKKLLVNSQVKHYVADLEPLASAAIALKITFDKVFSVKDGSDQMVEVCDSIGKAVESECQMRHYEEHAPGLLATLKKNYWHRSIGTQQKVTVIQTLMNRYDVKQWQTWGRANRVKLGAWLLDCIMSSSGWFEKQTVQQGRKRLTIVAPTPEFLEIKIR